MLDPLRRFERMVKENIRIGAVVSEFNYDITMAMLQRATEQVQGGRNL